MKRYTLKYGNEDGNLVDVKMHLADEVDAEIAELKRKNDQLWNYADRLYRFYVKNMESLLEGADPPFELWKHKGE